MGDFDDQIAWLRERKEVAESDLSDMRSGLWHHSLNGVDVTERIMRRTEEDIRRFEVLIAAYESHNSD